MRLTLSCEWPRRLCTCHYRTTELPSSGWNLRNMIDAITSRLARRRNTCDFLRGERLALNIITIEETLVVDAEGHAMLTLPPSVKPGCRLRRRWWKCRRRAFGADWAVAGELGADEGVADRGIIYPAFTGTFGSTSAAANRAVTSSAVSVRMLRISACAGSRSAPHW